MSATREEVAELVMKIFDRLEQDEYKNCIVEDAIILVELTDRGEGGEDDETVMVMEGTTDRSTVQFGMFEFAARSMVGGIEAGEE